MVEKILPRWYSRLSGVVLHSLDQSTTCAVIVGLICCGSKMIVRYCLSLALGAATLGVAVSSVPRIRTAGDAMEESEGERSRGIRTLRTNTLNGEDQEFLLNMLEDMTKSMPTASPVTKRPTLAPTRSPTRAPTTRPTRAPTSSPVTTPPTNQPAAGPSPKPTPKPTQGATGTPTTSPMRPPTLAPTLSPTTVSPTHAPTYLPTSSPTQRCGMTPEARELLIRIVLNSVSNPVLIDTPGTPQYDAFEWIVNLDMRYVCPSAPDLTQRYVLAVFYYSTIGASWTQCNAPTDFESQEAIDIANANCNITGGDGTDAWLTPSSECTWGGVFCIPVANATVEKLDIGE